MSDTGNLTQPKDTTSILDLNFRHRLSTENGNLNNTNQPDCDAELRDEENSGVKAATKSDVITPEYEGTKQTSNGKKKRIKPSRTLEKSTFMCTSAFMVILSHAVLSFQWMLPYIYLLLTPIVIGLRLYMYWKKQWQHFMLDFCYYVNIVCIVFLCMPSSRLLFSVMFALSTGPLMWAIFVYQKSLVLHRLDKVTSTYLHMLPPLISFTIRWYPKAASKYWFGEFLQDTNDLPLSWTYLLPFVVFLCYSMIYAFVDNFLWDHTDVTTAIRRRHDAVHDAVPHSLFYCVDERCRCLMFYIRVWLFCLLTLIGCQLCLYSYTVNYLCVAALGLVVIWNGGSYYVHVFSVKGFSEEKEDMKNI